VSEGLPNQRAIVDRRELGERLAALAEESAGGAPGREAVLPLFKATLAGGRDEVRRRLEAGAHGPEITHALSFLVDQLIRTAFDFAAQRVYPLSNPTKSERMAIVAVGGYGRGELAFHSDVDLLFLFPYKPPPWGEQVVEWLLYLLWDLGLKVGHATRSIEECVRLAKADATIRTAMLESRLIYGDQPLYLDFRKAFGKLLGSGTKDFIDAKLAERDERHRRMGDSRYVVEPNVKEGKGGLRDLHTLFWIAKSHYRVDSIAALADKHVFTPSELRQFAQAHDFLWTVRCHLHALSGRAEERVTFDRQTEIARRLGYADRPGSRGVERFMKHYFLVAKNVGDLTRIFCAALEAQHARRPRLRLLGFGVGARKVDGFVVESGRLGLAKGDSLERNPRAALRLFHVAQTHGFDVHPDMLRDIRRNLRLVDGLRADAEANRLFLEIMTSPRDPETALRRLNEAGVFGRFVPDFGRVVAQMQYDMYHSYTVDEHTIRAIGVLSALERGELAKDMQLPSEVVREVLSRRVLYVAVLLHDIAKGRGGDHSVLGEAVADKLCPRLGFDPSETETVAWLVRNHLAMSNVALKRDVDDPRTVLDFARLVQSPERLRLLLCLTVVDIRAVGPQVWNAWKGQLLSELYWRAEEALRGGFATEGREARIRARQDALRARLVDWTADAVDRYLARHAKSYWLSADVDSQERQARLFAEAEAAGRALAIAHRIDPGRGVTEVTVLAEDHPGLFARIAGAMAVSGANIVDARIATTLDGKAIDGFVIQDAAGGPFDRPEKLQRLEAAIEQTLTGRIVPAKVLEERRRKALVRPHAFAVAPRVLIDNRSSASNTVIEINGRDRPGLLHDITRALYDLSLSISSAHIATYGERAVDTFYVRDLFGLKIDHEGKLRRIEERLLKAIEDPDIRGHKPESEDAAERAKGRGKRPAAGRHAAA